MSEGVEVICVGLSRTGTSSLKAALSILLPGVTYHGMDFLNEINDESSFIFWSAMAEGRASSRMVREYFTSRQCSAVSNLKLPLIHISSIIWVFPRCRYR